MEFDSVEHERDVLRHKLDMAESLLTEASSMLNRVHCYDTNLYREIHKYLYGEEE